jgi:hypothetical protein
LTEGKSGLDLVIKHWVQCKCCNQISIESEYHLFSPKNISISLSLLFSCFRWLSEEEKHIMTIFLVSDKNKWQDFLVYFSPLYEILFKKSNSCEISVQNNHWILLFSILNVFICTPFTTFVKKFFADSSIMYCMTINLLDAN